MWIFAPTSCWACSLQPQVSRRRGLRHMSLNRLSAATANAMPPDHQRHDLGAEIPLQRHGHHGAEHRSMNIVNSCDGWNIGAWKLRASAHPALAADVLTSGRSRPMIAIANRIATTGRHSQDEAVALDRNEHVALDAVAQHEAEHERRPRPPELLHQPADQAEQQQREQVAPRARRLERADIDDAQHRRQDQRVAQRRERANCGLNA